MAPRTTAATVCRRATPMIATVCLSTLLAACGTPGPSAEAVDLSNIQASDRFGNEGTRTGYTEVVPRAWVSDEQLESDAPETYTVVRGDTLWDISDRFLKEPWAWPTVWNYNPQIANPHLIYPGDVIALEYVNGKATLVLTRDGTEVPMMGAAMLDANGEPIIDENGEPRLGAARDVNVTRLSPRIRSESLDNAVPTIPGDAIQQLLSRSRIVTLDAIDRAPYVIANPDGMLLSSFGDRIYVRGKFDRSQTRYGIFRPSKTLRDPVTGERLGHEVEHIADAKLLNVDAVSTLVITSSTRETARGDLLLPTSNTPSAHMFTPRLPELEGEGRIISMHGALSQTGRNQVVVLNLGTRSGIEVGDVLAIESDGGKVIDRRGRRGFEPVKLPSTRTGVLMVFETFDKVSYALIMESNRPVVLNDLVTGI